MECSPLWLPELVHFNHSQDELGYHLRPNVLPFPFCVSPGGMVSGKKTASLVQFLDLCVILPVSYLQWQQNERFVLTVFQWISAQKFTSEPSFSGGRDE